MPFGRQWNKKCRETRMWLLSEKMWDMMVESFEQPKASLKNLEKSALWTHPLQKSNSADSSILPLNKLSAMQHACEHEHEESSPAPWSSALPLQEESMRLNIILRVWKQSMHISKDLKRSEEHTS